MLLKEVLCGAYGHILLCIHFPFDSFNVAVISSACPASNGVVIVNNEFEWMCENVS
jgi:hypothetical protein